jgi:hypothetical protein
MATATAGLVGEVGAPVGDLLERHAEVFGEFVVGAVRDRGELVWRDQRFARVALAAVRPVVVRLAGQLPGLDVAGVEREEADEALERVAVVPLGDVRREVEAFRTGDRDGLAPVGDECRGRCRPPARAFRPY